MCIRDRYMGSESKIVDWFTQICLAMKHVHEKKIIHRDIKSQNIFLTKEGNIKLGDFGIAIILSHTFDKAKTSIGTPYYLSPEIIERRPYSFKSDVWSLGVLLYEMCALKYPFQGESLISLGMRIVQGSYNPIPGHYTKELKDLIARMLNLDPERRPSVTEILESPLIQSRLRSHYLPKPEYVPHLGFIKGVPHDDEMVEIKVKIDGIIKLSEHLSSNQRMSASPSRDKVKAVAGDFLKDHRGSDPEVHLSNNLYREDRLNSNNSRAQAVGQPVGHRAVNHRPAPVELFSSPQAPMSMLSPPNRQFNPQSARNNYNTDSNQKVIPIKKQPIQKSYVPVRESREYQSQPNQIRNRMLVNDNNNNQVHNSNVNNPRKSPATNHSPISTPNGGGLRRGFVSNNNYVSHSVNSSNAHNGNGNQAGNMSEGYNGHYVNGGQYNTNPNANRQPQRKAVTPSYRSNPSYGVVSHEPKEEILRMQHMQNMYRSNHGRFHSLSDDQDFGPQTDEIPLVSVAKLNRPESSEDFGPSPTVIYTRAPGNEGVEALHVIEELKESLEKPTYANAKERRPAVRDEQDSLELPLQPRPQMNNNMQKEWSGRKEITPSVWSGWGNLQHIIPILRQSRQGIQRTKRLRQEIKFWLT
eukprot:TRINITY_DN4461_c0_g1_i5.p1 TRINITY_DN4461_c0_g1~~TRINITY_DN4461_c0_g1_i5.p1  ORF type:complete len:639 (-),score=39.67 TRINITY_DN4461_c0_g1_i5:980-2896(-)